MNFLTGVKVVIHRAMRKISEGGMSKWEGVIHIQRADQSPA